jgi:hypothetical protein
MFPIHSGGRGLLLFQLVFISVWLSRCSMFLHWKSLSLERMMDFTEECWSSCCLGVGARISISECKSSHQNAAELLVVCEWRMQLIMVAIVL